MLSYNQLVDIVRRGIISPVKMENINATSIDIHLGPNIIIEKNRVKGQYVDPKKRENFPNESLFVEGCYELLPGEFVLGHSVELFSLPNNISAEFRLKSSGARSGLNNLFACHCDAGWHGSTLTIELHNVLRFTKIRLTPGMAIGQMIFHEHEPVPDDASYAARGRYNNDKGVSTVKF